MRSTTNHAHNKHRSHPPEVVDLLPANKSEKSFRQRVSDLQLSKDLEQKIIACSEQHIDGPTDSQVHPTLTIAEEKELATEVLIYRHRFTEQVVEHRTFKQAALSVIQNIYLFKNRKIFFSSDSHSTEEERQEAILLLTNHATRSVPLRYTFQHLIISRIWQRIIGKQPVLDDEEPLKEIHFIVERLNTLRNIYVMLSTGLVRKLAAQISDIYKQSVSYEDAVQIGSFGIARAAYRYHPTMGVRFSTYASKWVFSEIQRQALRNRLVRISTNNIEQFSKALKSKDQDKINKYTEILKHRSCTLTSDDLHQETAWSAEDQGSLSSVLERKQLRSVIEKTIDAVLSEKAADVIRRRYGFPPYETAPQSVIEISKYYDVSRGSIYQLESNALKKLQHYLEAFA